MARPQMAVRPDPTDKSLFLVTRVSHKDISLAVGDSLKRNLISRRGHRGFYNGYTVHVWDFKRKKSLI